MQVRDQLYIGGRWAASRGNNSIDVINASTEEVMGRVPEGGENDVNDAVAAARRVSAEDPRDKNFLPFRAAQSERLGPDPGG